MANVRFLWGPGTGESYVGDVREGPLNTSYGWIADDIDPSISLEWMGYPSTYGPVGSGPLGDSYNNSRDLLMNKMIDTIKKAPTDDFFILGGYSQGAAAAWMAANYLEGDVLPELHGRVIACANIANPMRPNGPTIGNMGVGKWGVANQGGKYVKPHYHVPIELVNPRDMIGNSDPDSILRFIADWTEFMSFEDTGALSAWAHDVYADLITYNWQAEVQNFADLPKALDRFKRAGLDIKGYLTGQHTVYPSLVFPNGDGETYTKVFTTQVNKVYRNFMTKAEEWAK